MVMQTFADWTSPQLQSELHGSFHAEFFKSAMLDSKPVLQLISFQCLPGLACCRTHGKLKVDGTTPIYFDLVDN